MSLEAFIVKEKSKQCRYCMSVIECKKNCYHCQHLKVCNEEGELLEKVGMNPHGTTS